MPCSREVCRSPFDRKQIAIPWCHLEYDSVQLFLQAAIGYRDARFVQDTIRCVMSAIRLWVKRKFFTTTTGRIGASGTAAARVMTGLLEGSSPGCVPHYEASPVAARVLFRKVADGAGHLSDHFDLSQA